MTHRSTTAALAALLSAMPLLSHAAFMQSDDTFLSGTTWLADFTVINDGNPTQLTGCTIYSPEDQFGDGSLMSKAFTVVLSGTALVSVVPESASMLLAGLELCDPLAAARRQRGRASQDASEMTA